MVEIVITHIQLLISFMALLDCGATSFFMDKGFVDRNRITARTLSRPIPVYNIDGTWNKAGSICEVMDFILRYKDHSERVQFTVTGLGKQDAILGYIWLKDHNPEVDWITKEVKMSRCSGHCSTCRMEIKQECHQRQTEACHLHSCQIGSMPTVEEIFEDPLESWKSSDDCYEDDLGRNAEQALDEMSDKTSDGSDHYDHSP
jgi:hypothetical protein